MPTTPGHELELALEHDGELGEAGSDAAKLLRIHEQIFDQMPALVRLGVVGCGLPAVRTRWDGGYSAARSQKPADVIAVIGFTAQQFFGFRQGHFVEERCGLWTLGGVARFQTQLDEPSYLVRQRNDFDVEPTAIASEGLLVSAWSGGGRLLGCRYHGRGP